MLDLEKMILKNEASLKQLIVEQSQESLVEIGGIKTCFDILEKECKNRLAGLDEINRNVRWTIQQETEKVFHSLKTE